MLRQLKIVSLKSENDFSQEILQLNFGIIQLITGADVKGGKMFGRN